MPDLGQGEHGLRQNFGQAAISLCLSKTLYLQIGV